MPVVINIMMMWDDIIDKVVNREVHWVHTFPSGGNVMEQCEQILLLAQAICPLDGINIVTSLFHM